MKSISLIAGVALLAACASPQQPGGSAMSDGSTVFTLVCNDSWEQCYTNAAKICGSGDFEEVDRAMDTTVTSAGQLSRMHSLEGGIKNHVYSENTREEVLNRVLTIRCRKGVEAP